jgi:hypothetical protein
MPSLVDASPGSKRSHGLRVAVASGFATKFALPLAPEPPEDGAALRTTTTAAART